jgi:hypothetical protein
VSATVAVCRILAAAWNHCRETSNTMCYAAVRPVGLSATRAPYVPAIAGCSRTLADALFCSDTLPYTVVSRMELCRHASRLTAINFSVPSGPVQWDRYLAPDEEVHGPRRLAIHTSSSCKYAAETGFIPCSCRSSRRPAGRHTRSNYLTVRHVEGLLVHAALHVIYEGGWAPAMRAIERPWLLTPPCMKTYLPSINVHIRISS